MQTQPNTTASQHTDSKAETLHQDRWFLRLPEVCELTGLSRSSIYNIPGFPARVSLSPRLVAWKRSDVMEWIANRPIIGRG